MQLHGTDCDEWQVFLRQRKDGRWRWQWPLNIAVVLHISIFAGMAALQNMTHSRLHLKMDNVVMVKLSNIPAALLSVKPENNGNITGQPHQTAEAAPADGQRQGDEVTPTPAQGRIARSLPLPPKITATRPKPLTALPPAQRTIVRNSLPLPEIAPTSLKPLTALPPVQRKIARHFLPPPALAQTSLKPLETLPPEPQRISQQELLQKNIVQDERAVRRSLPKDETTEQAGLEEGDAAGSAAQVKVIGDEGNVSNSAPNDDTTKWDSSEEGDGAGSAGANISSSQDQTMPLGDDSSAQTGGSAAARAGTGTDGVGGGRGQGSISGSSSGTDTGAGNTEAAPLYASNPPPEYPMPARRRGIEGTVIIEALIDTSGSVADLRLSASSGYSILDNAALTSVHSWRFQPGTIDGKQQAMWVKVPVRFALSH